MFAAGPAKGPEGEGNLAAALGMHMHQPLNQTLNQTLNLNPKGASLTLAMMEIQCPIVFNV